ncbi:MAG: preprotein translocase subunit YajC [Armatimonadota bacterium]
MGDISFQEILPVIIFAVAMLVIWWYLIIRPSRQRHAEHQEVIKSVETGDRVETVGGIYGTVTQVRQNQVRLKIAEDVVITLDRRAVRNRAEEDD